MKTKNMHYELHYSIDCIFDENGLSISTLLENLYLNHIKNL